MNKYEIRVNNAVIIGSGYNEYNAMNDLGIFQDILEIVDCFHQSNKPVNYFAWIYKVKMHNNITIAVVKRIGEEM